MGEIIFLGLAFGPMIWALVAINAQFGLWWIMAAVLAFVLPKRLDLIVLFIWGLAGLIAASTNFLAILAYLVLAYFCYNIWY